MTRSSRPVWLGVDNRRWDHCRVHFSVLKDDRLDAYCLAVYLGLAAHAEASSGDARPAVATLAAYARCSEYAVRKALRSLEDAGYIGIEQRSGKASFYRLMPPPTPASGEGVPRATREAPPRETRATPASGAGELEPRTRTMNKGGAGRGEPPEISGARFDRVKPWDPSELCDHGLPLKALCEDCIAERASA